MNPSALPPSFLKCLSPSDRKSLGKAGILPEEALAKQEAKSEKVLQNLIINLLRLKGIEPLVHRMDKKSAATVGWMDLTFAIAVDDAPKLVPLGRRGDGAALVSEEDFELVSQFRWTPVFSGNSMYAISTVRPRRMMHRTIMSQFPNLENKMDIDHINGDGLDNRRENLRWATRSENCMNRAGAKGSSEYKGVSWDKERRKWAAFIKINKKNTPLGRFDLEVDAATAYDRAAVEAYGPFAVVNFPLEPRTQLTFKKSIAVGWEVKTSTGKLSKEQEQMHIRLSTPPNCWRVRVVRSVDEALAELKEMGIQ